MTDRWQTRIVSGRTWRYARLETAFQLNGIEYPPGSYVVQQQDAPFSNAMTQKEFDRWMAAPE